MSTSNATTLGTKVFDWVGTSTMDSSDLGVSRWTRYSYGHTCQDACVSQKV